MNKPKAIIPCAGLGTRMGMRIDQSKEMLFLNDEDHPCIDYVMEICQMNNIEPIVVSRKEKYDLNHYLEYEWHTKPLIVEPQGEWMDTVLASAPTWSVEQNILMLPDTRWRPKYHVVNQLLDLSLTTGMALGMHHVDDQSKWGSLVGRHIWDKPPVTNPGLAWGLLAFSMAQGLKFFTDMGEEVRTFYMHEGYAHPMILLEQFDDITRGAPKPQDFYGAV